MGKKYCISQSPFWKNRVWSFLISMLETQSNPGGPFQHAAFKFASTRLCQKALQPQKKNNPKLNLDRNFIGSFLVHQNSLGIFSCITKHPRRMLRWISKIIEPWALEAVYLTSHFKSVVLGFFLRVSTWRIFPVGTVRISPSYYAMEWVQSHLEGEPQPAPSKNENDDHGYLPSKYSFNCCSNHPTISNPSSWVGRCQVLSLAMDQDQCLAQQLAHYASRRVGKNLCFC